MIKATYTLKLNRSQVTRMINLETLDYTIITASTLLRIVNDPFVRSVTPYSDRKGLQCYSIVTTSGERYKVFTRGKVL